MICEAAEGRKADDILVMEMGERTSVCEYFIVMSAPSTVRVKAIVDFIDEELESEDIRVLHKEGYRDGSWVLMDYGSVIVHVFHQDMRRFYDIENIWGDVPKKKYFSQNRTGTDK